ncbi:hypothetical protein LshimejAT787_0501130 [Lyophyllum shimeji]|uniref:Uncharacterized protein n=1 Tax=Lyophyllum shimeji TaxID=47721 RepID=A0A9P3PLQ8_LYOSH|nr:hypothetical protein LshimejAT787_0501130 [Lyophyllum shimeji]
MPRGPRRKGLSKKQKDQLQAARDNRQNKENIPPPPPKARGSLRGQLYAAEQALKAAERRADVEKRRADENKCRSDANATRFWNERRKNQRLSGTVGPLKERATAAETTLVEVRRELQLRVEATEKMREGFEAKISELTRHTTKLATTLDLVRKANRALKEKSRRAPERLKKAIDKARSRPKSFQLTHRGMYTPAARALMRAIVQSGCPRNKVGVVIQRVGQFLGIKIKHAVDRRTVGRAILEGGVASKLQLGYEMAVAKSLTLSGDSTSHRKINYDARHVQMRVPDYASGSLEPSEDSTPAIRLLGVESSADHSSELARDTWVDRLKEAGELYNESPLAKRIGVKFTIRHLVHILRGMNGDHASTEKRTASLLNEWKQEETLLTNKKILDAGGLDAWNALSEEEKLRRDVALMKEIKLELGREEYNKLSAEDKRMVDLFIWAGRCMHKDQNSFKGGNAEMVAWWPTVNKTAPMTLANKENAAILQKILDPAARGHAAPSTDQVTDLELAALEASTQGGAKTIFDAIRRCLAVLESENMEVVADWCDEEEMGDEN